MLKMLENMNNMNKVAQNARKHEQHEQCSKCSKKRTTWATNLFNYITFELDAFMTRVQLCKQFELLISLQISCIYYSIDTKLSLVWLCINVAALSIQ